MEQTTAMTPGSEVRRRDRAVHDEAWIGGMLELAPVASVATAQDGEPYVNVNIFLYDRSRHAIYLHTARHGHFRASVEGNARACLCVHTMGKILPAPTARNFSVEYEGVVVFGTITVVDDVTEKTDALHALVAKYSPHLELGRDYSSVTASDLRDTSLYRLDIEEWSGKRKVAGSESVGAFEVPHLRFGTVPLTTAGDAE
jgi:nitroimidazol reductase NimA-like FMN-containing flavoprotein (pyridoxamine 5'-phosphate oxidase superfamily)